MKDIFREEKHQLVVFKGKPVAAQLFKNAQILTLSPIDFSCYEWWNLPAHIRLYMHPIIVITEQSQKL